MLYHRNFGLFITAMVMIAPQLSIADSLSDVLTETIQLNVGDLSSLKMPKDNNLSEIPADPKNPITKEKVALGKLLFHETGVGTATLDSSRSETYSCATCHHAAAGFKAGTKQGIGDGGLGFGRQGEGRVLGADMDVDAKDGNLAKLPDLQPLASPAALNVAYQDVMLWNGSFGSRDGGVNSVIEDIGKAGPQNIKANLFGLSGVETQVLAGTHVHRLRFDADSYLQSLPKYRNLYRKAFPDGDTGIIPHDDMVKVTVTAEALGAAKAIAAFERTIISNQAPFQRWLWGDKNALSKRQLRGGILFFGEAGCSGCHKGPALSSEPGASADEIFFSIGFADFDPNDPDIHLAGNTVPENISLGRGGFTGDELDNHKFKVPQLYNLKDSDVFGHGASFSSVKEVIEYKNAGIPQKEEVQNLAFNEGFMPLGLTRREIRDLTAFVSGALYDPNLSRYTPKRLPTGNCFPVADLQSALDLGCIGSD